jgi:hypothetical protein
MPDRDGRRVSIELPMDAWWLVRDALHIADEWSTDQAQLAADHATMEHHAKNAGEYAAIRFIIIAQL